MSLQNKFEMAAVILIALLELWFSFCGEKTAQGWC
jgi:hypothetical protein